MDGFAATSEIRRLEATGVLRPGKNRLPVIALTAQAVQGDRERCLACGMSEYLTKPIDRELLLRTLARLIDETTPPPGIQPASIAAPDGANPDRIVDGPAYDLESLAARCLGNVDFAISLLDRFAAGTDESVERLRSAADRGDWSDLARQAHALKGSAANLSADALRDAAASLEAICRAGVRDEGVSAVEQLVSELDRCRRQIHSASRERAVANSPDALTT